MGVPRWDPYSNIPETESVFVRRRTAGPPPWAQRRQSRVFATPSGPSPSSRSESRLNERLARLLNQKKGPDAVIVAVLSVVLVFGLLRFALHCLWVVAIIVMALGLGFTVVNSRRNRVDVVNHRAERRSDAEDRRSESDSA
jgi:type IV secretory pathway VirB2 component (pilin)